MTPIEGNKEPSDEKDEKGLKSLEDSLYTRLREVLEPRIDSLLEARAEYFLPEYYDRVVTSEIRRLESAIEHNGRRIDELRSYMDQRFDDVDQRFEQIDQRFGQIDQRFEQIDQRFGQIDQRFGQIDQRFEQIDQRFGQIDQRFEQIDGRLGRIDGRLGRIDGRLDRVDDRFDEVTQQIETTRDRVDQVNQNLRNWIILGFAFLGTLFTVIQLYL